MRLLVVGAGAFFPDTTALNESCYAAPHNTNKSCPYTG